jgi:tetratricopeptide (TPR) repeat protein
MDSFTLHKHAEDLRDQAWTLRLEGHYVQAVIVYESSRELYRQLGDRSKQSSVLMEMGDTTLEVDDLDTARHYYDRARAVFRTRSIPTRHKINLLEGLKIISLRQQDLRQALLELSQLLNVYEQRLDMVLEYASTLKQLGEIADQLGHITDSDSYFAQALRWGDRDHDHAVIILWAWGMAQYRRSQPEQGARLCELALLRTAIALEKWGTGLVLNPSMTESRRLQRLFDTLQQQFNDRDFVHFNTGDTQRLLDTLQQQFNEMNADDPSSRQSG